MIDCLCVTSGSRHKFKDWLLWNFTKQCCRDKRLVVVSDDTDWPDWVLVKEVSSHLNVPQKRNIALDISNSTIVTWFDDDDWQHPEKCSILMRNVVPGTVVGSDISLFVSPISLKQVSVSPGRLIFNSIGIEKTDSPLFNEEVLVASDTIWMDIVLERLRTRVVPEMLTFLLVHSDNISNKEKDRKPNVPLSREVIGEATWQALKKLAVHLENN